MPRPLIYLSLMGVIIGSLLWWLSAPQTLITQQQVNSIKVDINNGKHLFYIGGCSSCHQLVPALLKDTLSNSPLKETSLKETPSIDSEEAPIPLAQLGGGKRFTTPFGTFIAPNISPDKATGIGNWSDLTFANALISGVSPSGEHYYPAFPYTSYTRMQLQDVLDLKAYLNTLPAINRQNEAHQLSLPFSIRRTLGLWKRLFFSKEALVKFDNVSPIVKRGQYLVEGPGHCGECHTQRNKLGALNKQRWLAGAALETGNNEAETIEVPNITHDESGLRDWSEGDIINYLETGFTPEYDVAGEVMAEVIENTSQISDEDRAAIAAYLLAIPVLLNPEE